MARVNGPQCVVGTRGVISAGIVLVALGILAAADPPPPPRWTPPLGIPAPPFGITQVAGPTTARVAAGGSIPTLQPGAVVQLEGAFPGRHKIVCAGTQAAPAFLRGPARFSGEVTVTGTWCILENLQFVRSDPNGGPLAVLSPSSHVVIRRSEVSAPALGRASAGIGIGAAGPGGTNAETVLYANTIHAIGDRNVTTDQDGHGVGIGVADRVWVLDNTISRCSGDGLQINGTLARTHHIYVGRNLSFDNKQMGFWTKTAADVVFSQNVTHSHRPSGSSPGGGLGFQYDPQRVWFLFNESYNNTLGFVTGSSNRGGRRDVYLLGNLFRDNLQAGVQLNGGVDGDFLVAANTIAGSPLGIENGYYPASPRLTGNLFVGISGHHAVFDKGPSTSMSRCLFDSGPRLVGLTCQGCRTRDPRLLAYRPQAGSPAIDAGEAPPAAAAYQALYGVSIAWDRDGVPRPQGPAWDIGAYEYQAGPRSP